MVWYRAVCGLRHCPLVSYLPKSKDRFVERPPMCSVQPRCQEWARPGVVSDENQFCACQLVERRKRVTPGSTWREMCGEGKVTPGNHSAQERASRVPVSARRVKP